MAMEKPQKKSAEKQRVIKDDKKDDKKDEQKLRIKDSSRGVARFLAHQAGRYQDGISALADPHREPIDPDTLDQLGIEKKGPHLSEEE